VLAELELVAVHEAADALMEAEAVRVEGDRQR